MRKSAPGATHAGVASNVIVGGASPAARAGAGAVRFAAATPTAMATAAIRALDRGPGRGLGCDRAREVDVVTEERAYRRAVAGPTQPGGPNGIPLPVQVPPTGGTSDRDLYDFLLGGPQ